MSKRRKKSFTESDLFEPLKAFLEKRGYELRAEVLDCDVVATKGEDLMALELKKAFNLRLVYQCLHRYKFADQVYAVTAAPKGGQMSRTVKESLNLLKRIGVGLILVYMYESGSRVEIVLEPCEQAIRKNKKKRAKVLKEFNGRSGNHNLGGHQGKVLTAYKEAAIHIAVLLSKLETSSSADLRKIGAPENTHSILYNDHYEWFEKVSRGKYGLRRGTKKALKTFPKIVTFYKKKYKTLPKETALN